MDTESNWNTDLESALSESRLTNKAVLLQFHREECAGCKKMYEHTFPNAEVQQEILQWFIPVRLDILNNRGIRARYSAYWTPSFFFLNTRGEMLYSFNGYLDVEDFRVLLRLGKAAIDLPRGRYLETITLMDKALDLFPNTPKSASLLFIRGMAEYLLGKEKSGFRDAMTEIQKDYPQSLEARMWPWMDK